MPRTINRLSARAVSAVTKRGYHPDGAGLYLQVTSSAAKSWIYRYTLGGRTREMGLGSLRSTSLAQARVLAEQCRRQIREGLEPITARREQRAAGPPTAGLEMTFGACADAYVNTHKAGWRNAKHAGQWRATLQTYALPALGERPVKEVDTNLVMQVLDPIWHAKTETASRIRGRIEAILDWATVRGHRQGDNPARWRGHLDHLLPERAKVQKVVHHPALPYDQVPRFMAELRRLTGVAARGLEFQILTAGRTGEIIGARWSEIDEAGQVWTIPGERMKAGREHRVALSSAALAVIRRMRAVSQSDFIFSGLRPGRPLSNMAFLQLLKRMGRSDITAHGFRSSFRDWAAEQTSYPRDIVEMTLAHAIGDRVEAAYLRSDLLEKRHRLLQDWAVHCSSATPADTGTAGRFDTEPAANDSRHQDA